MVVGSLFGGDFGRFLAATFGPDTSATGAAAASFRLGDSDFDAKSRLFMATGYGDAFCTGDFLPVAVIGASTLFFQC